MRVLFGSFSLSSIFYWSDFAPSNSWCNRKSMMKNQQKSDLSNIEPPLIWEVHVCRFLNWIHYIGPPPNRVHYGVYSKHVVSWCLFFVLHTHQSNMAGCPNNPHTLLFFSLTFINLGLPCLFIVVSWCCLKGKCLCNWSSCWFCW